MRFNNGFWQSGQHESLYLHRHRDNAQWSVGRRKQILLVVRSSSSPRSFDAKISHPHPHPRYSNSTRGRGSPAVPATHLMIQSATLTWTVSPAAAVISLGTATQPPCIIASRLALRKCGPTAHRRADGRGCGRGRLWPSDPRNGLSNT